MLIRWENGGRGPLLSCGLDAEMVSRFAKLVGDPRPWPQIFSALEAAHAARLGDPAAGLCASFCCKEALVKALETTYLYPECELLYVPGREEQEVMLSAGIRERHRIASARARLLAPREGELAAVVYLYGEPHA